MKEYYSKDKERRCLEYSIYQRELSEVVEVLERVSSSCLMKPRSRKIILSDSPVSHFALHLSSKTRGVANSNLPTLREESLPTEKRIFL